MILRLPPAAEQLPRHRRRGGGGRGPTAAHLFQGDGKARHRLPLLIRPNHLPVLFPPQKPGGGEDKAGHRHPLQGAGASPVVAVQQDGKVLEGGVAKGRGEGLPRPQLLPVRLHLAGVVFSGGLGGVKEPGEDRKHRIGLRIKGLGGGGGEGEAVGDIPEEMAAAVGGVAVHQGEDVIPRWQQPRHRSQPLQRFLQAREGGGDGVRPLAQLGAILWQAVSRRQQGLAGGAAAGLDKSQGCPV